MRRWHSLKAPAALLNRGGAATGPTGRAAVGLGREIRREWGWHSHQASPALSPDQSALLQPFTRDKVDSPRRAAPPLPSPPLHGTTRHDNELRFHRISSMNLYELKRPGLSVYLGLG